MAFILVDDEDCCDGLTADSDCQALLWSVNPTFNAGAVDTTGTVRPTPRCRRTLNQMRMLYQPTRWLNEDRFDDIIASSSASTFAEVDDSLCTTLTDANRALCSDYRAERCFNGAPSTAVASVFLALLSLAHMLL